MKSWLKALIPVAAFVALAACGNKNTLPDAGSGVAEGGGSSVGGASTAGQGAGNGITGSELDQARARALQTLVIYFDYDQAEIKPEFTQVVQAHGQRLASNGSMQVRLEGHTDERGSREYNIGLGERRAQAVRRALMLAGAQAGQITTVSYGEERPAATGSDEESWRLNRRVEIVYR
jgi:peptidoglycan-associated lipoprotein